MPASCNAKVLFFLKHFLCSRSYFVTKYLVLGHVLLQKSPVLGLVLLQKPYKSLMLPDKFIYYIEIALQI